MKWLHLSELAISLLGEKRNVLLGTFSTRKWKTASKFCFSRAQRGFVSQTGFVTPDFPSSAGHNCVTLTDRAGATFPSSLPWQSEPWPCSCPRSAKLFILSCFNKVSFKHSSSCFLSPHTAAPVPRRGKQWKRQELSVFSHVIGLFNDENPNLPLKASLNPLFFPH